MSGHNHYPDCTCGWCSGGNKIATIESKRTSPFWAMRWTYDSFTIPNATCKYCGALVFFHQAINGGRVFFDSLGPPWPKHDCRSQSTEPSVQAKDIEITGNSGSVVHWLDDGWDPIYLERLALEDDWWVLKCRRYADRAFFRVLSAIRVEGLRGSPAFLRMNASGKGILSFLQADGKIYEMTVYDYSSFCLMTPFEVAQTVL